MNKFTTIRDAINWMADTLNIPTDGAEWVYENTDCPAWDDEGFAEYDFLSDRKINEIPENMI